MDDESSLSRAFSVLALAARSFSGTGEASCSHAICLSEEMLTELHDVFGTIDRPCGNFHVERSKMPVSNENTPNCSDSNAEMWEELARQGISLASIVQGLSGAMEKGGNLGIMAADVYLGLMLAPGCPLYSLFSQAAFNSLLRCIRHSCKPVIVPEQEGSTTRMAEVKLSIKGRGGKRKGRNGAGRSTGLQEVSLDDHPFSTGAFQNNSGVPRQATLETVLQLLMKLQATLRVFHLKDHQESLRSLMELLVELPHIVSEMQAECDIEVESRAKRATQHHVPSSLRSALNVCMGIMRNLLEPSHGNPVDTSVALLKLLAPSILLTRAGGSTQQRSQIREQALCFVTTEPRSCHRALRSSVAALPRYLAMKAPEKTDPRALAVESIMTVVKILSIKEQANFGHFVAKLSRGKPRNRLLAVDLALALLGALPDPLGLDKEGESYQKEGNWEEENTPIEGGNAPMEKVNVPMDQESVQAKNVSKDSAELEGVAARPLPEHSGGTRVWWGTACLEALLHRCSDKIPAIRARALSNLAQALEKLCTNIRNRAALQSLLGFGTMAQASNKEAEFSLRKSAVLNNWHTPGRMSPSLGGQTPSPEPSAIGPGASPLSPGAGHGDLGSLLRRRCLDDKAAVRKSTLLLMSKSASLLGRPPDETMLEAMGSACADPMVSIRKVAMSALSEMMRKFPADTKVVKEWFQSVLPLIVDNESSIQEECLTLFEELVLDRIAAVAASRFLGSGIAKSSLMDGSILKLTWEQELERLMPPGILVLLRGMADDSAVASCVKRVCMVLGKKKKLRAGIALALQNIITSSRALWYAHNREGSICQQDWTAPSGAWFLLAEVSVFVPKAVGWEFLRTHWQVLEKREHVKTPSTSKTDHVVHHAAWAVDRVHLLQTISSVAIELPPDAAADLAAELLERLERLNMDPTEVGAHVKALQVLCIQKATSMEEGDRLVNTWVQELLEQAGTILNLYLSESGGGSSNRPLTSNAADDTNPRIIPAIFTIGALVLICPKIKFEHLATSLQALVTSGGLQKLSNFAVTEEIVHGVTAQAWVTLGKMCLVNHELAKRCIPLFLQELEKSDSAPVRNNIMIAMTDFCVRYTSLIDGYIHNLTKALRDPCELVRRQGFVLLAQLLQRDYLKWKGTLFHRFLLALVDESEKIRQMANFLFSSILKTKSPLLAYNSFVETIFVLNDCRAHAGHIEMFHMSESERQLFSLRGNVGSNVEKRIHIYGCLLKQMAPEHLLATSAKLCADILAAAADGMLNLEDPTAQCVLEDSLKILSSKEMRIGGNRGTALPDSLDGEEDGAAAFAAAKGRVVSHLAKRNLVQNAIPIFIELKRLLESKNSSLTGMLMECMRVMLKEYKNEIEELLVADKQLQKEIMYDMQKHEAAKAKAKVVAAAAVVLSPGSAWLRQRNGNAMDPARVVSHKTPITDKVNRATITGKENFSAVKGKGKDDGGQLDEGIKKASAGLSNKRKTFLSPEASRVRWMDQTPGLNTFGGAVPSRHMSTPRNMTGLAHAGETSNTAQDAERLQQEQSNMASAFADVVAEATAAVVLSEVVRRTPTGPLQSMSLPKLHATVPNTIKKAAGEGDDDALVSLTRGEETMASLESVRRRQSFSSADISGALT